MAQVTRTGFFLIMLATSERGAVTRLNSPLCSEQRVSQRLRPVVLELKFAECDVG